MSPDHEHETWDKTSNVSANSRHVSPERMRQFEGYVCTRWRYPARFVRECRAE